jgi:hypothetical protein
VTFADCHRCQDRGFLWLTDEGKVVAPDHIDAVVSFRCTHTGVMRKILAAFDRWKQDQPKEVTK